MAIWPYMAIWAPRSHMGSQGPWRAQILLLNPYIQGLGAHMGSQRGPRRAHMAETAYMAI